MPRKKFFLKLILSLGLVMGVTFNSGFAADAPSSAEADEKGQSSQKTLKLETGKGQGQEGVKSMMQKMQKLRSKLGQIQKQTLDSNPELAQERKELDNLMKSTLDRYMEEEGVDMDRLKQVMTKLKQKDLEKGKKQELQQVYRSAVQAYKKAKMKTMNNSTIQNKREKFGDKIIAAMKKENPNVEQKIEKMRSLQQKIRQSRAKSFPTPQKETQE